MTPPVTVPLELADPASGFTLPPLPMLPPLALTPPVVVMPPATTVPPAEVVPPTIVVPPETFTPPVADAPPEPATLASGRLTVPSLFEQFTTVAATSSRPATCKTRKQQGVADGVCGLEFGMDRVLLRNQWSPVAKGDRCANN
jgi:hypothetical protein